MTGSLFSRFANPTKETRIMKKTFLSALGLAVALAFSAPMIVPANAATAAATTTAKKPMAKKVVHHKKAAKKG
jgi:hypothetical protein